MEPRNTIIIGTGPAGLTAALYTARGNLSPLVIEGEEAGGQLMLTTDVENYPGFETGIMGPDLMAKMRAQAARFGAEYVTGDISEVELGRRPFVLRTATAEFQARSLIVATGARARWLGVPNERRLIGHGVSSCATCDGFFFKGEDIAVVGGGDSAIEEATFLTKFASSVTLIHRRESLRASKIMQDRARSNEKVRFLWNSEVEDVLDDDSGEVRAAMVRNVATGERSRLAIKGLFVAIGHIPNSTLFAGQLEMDSAGYILLKGGSRSSVPGVFVAGDVADHTYRQAVTAAGTGCMAAIDAERWLDSGEA